MSTFRLPCRPAGLGETKTAETETQTKARLSSAAMAFGYVGARGAVAWRGVACSPGMKRCRAPS